MDHYFNNHMPDGGELKQISSIEYQGTEEDLIDGDVKKHNCRYADQQPSQILYQENQPQL